MELWFTQHDGLHKGTDGTGMAVTLYQVTPTTQERAHLIGQSLKHINSNTYNGRE